MSGKRRATEPALAGTGGGATAGPCAAPDGVGGPAVAEPGRAVPVDGAMTTVAAPGPVAAALAAWYPGHHRRLPWRDEPDPWRVWVSEILLQQTRVETVLGRWDAFLARFPDARALAAASPDAVLKAWEGLGYYARARNLQRAAGIVVREHGGRFPDDPVAAMALPGIGRSTAGAILSIAYGRALPVLDGNVARVLARLDAIREPPTGTATARGLWARAQALVAAAPDPGTHNQAMMELGATVCVPRAPRCGECPVAALCRARAAGIAADLPARAARAAVPRHRFVAGVLVRDGRVLVRRRPGDGLLAGLWAFPGGRPAPGEADADALARHLRADLGISVTVGAQVGEIRHAYTHFRETVVALACVPRGGVPAPCPDGCRWVTAAELAALAMARAHRRLADAPGFPLPPDP